MKNLIVVLVLMLGASSFGQDGPLNAPPGRDLSAYEGRPRVRAERLNETETITLDGRLDEPVWKRAFPATDFKQQDPHFGEPATERTEVRMAFSRSSLYMGVTCFDSEPDKLLGNTMLRDAPLPSDDRFMWTFDPYLNGRTGYFFEMNPSGSMGDSLITGAGEGNVGGPGGGGGGGGPGGGGPGGGGGGGFGAARAWDGIWYAKVRKSDIGWSIEIEIPFRTMNFDPNAPAWGVNFQRTVKRKNEDSLWTGWARNQGLRRMSNAGLLEGISDVSQGVGLDIQPYATAAYNDGSGRGLPAKFKKDAGIDFFYNVTPQLRANFTLNTDFAETEVDQRRVNLTRFPLFFPERRAFFLEGSGFLDFSREPGNTIMPFFSRTIGLRDGNPQRIDYGTKLTGQVGSNDIGFLHVSTAASKNLIGEDFTVLRTKRRFFRQSYAGMIYTRRAERNSVVADRQTIGADFDLATTRFHGNQNLQFSGFYLRNTKTNDIGKTAAYGMRVDYPNDRWNARMSFREMQPGYKPAMGFVERTNVRAYNPILQFSPRPTNSRIVRRFSFESNLEVLTDLNNQLVTRELDLTVFDVNFQSGDFFQVHAVPTFERLEKNFEIDQGVVLPVGNAYNFTRYWAGGSTASRRPVSLNGRYENGTFYSGRRRAFNMGLGVRPRTGVLLFINNEWNRVELPEGKFSTSLLRLNAGTQFNPWISLINNVQYDSVSRILGWQFRFRWILRPGNDVYFVYAHNWLNELTGRHTLDRNAATKFIYTHRF